MSVPQDVTIIGAGLAGLSLALALHDQNIKATIYETRPGSYNMGGAVMLGPNALRVLDSIGKPESVYQRIASKGYNFDRLSFVNDEHVLSDIYYFGNKEMYGYTGHRSYRQVLVEELIAMCQERDISINYERKFTKIVTEDANSVTVEMADGEQISTGMLVGADGIHSKVRKHISDVVPKFGGLLAITSHIPRSAVRIPSPDYPLPVTIQSKMGAFIMAPQDHDGSELLVGTQIPYAALDRQGWEDLRNDKAKLYQLLTANKSTWNDVVQSAMEAMKPEELSTWPYHQIPRLNSWKSEAGRVILIGDAAHAIPPSAGQGVNQAFEDAYALASVLGSLSGRGPTLQRSLNLWEEWRKDRVDKVTVLTAQMNAKRLPEAQRKKVDNPTGEKGELDWLYKSNIDEVVAGWMKSQK